ncbi:MAG TPA: amino acid ABC transporter substrate-binding protein [Gemmatimonadaceae bacterium]|nr:amino acid ABC transporter substrate-binding protein [Gemmatimonadaceae bacterium]
MSIAWLIACSSGAPNNSSSPRQGATLAAIRARGTVKCGITQGAGFATPDDSGRWRGFDVDFCRALAVALFNNPNKVDFVPYTQQQRFSGLQSGEVDLLVNGSSITSSRALERNFHFGPIYFYDGQGFLMSKAAKVDRAAQLNGATVCVQQGTTTELNLTDFARRNHISFKPVVMEDLRAAVSALAGGRCDVISQDGAGLATTRTMLRNPNDYVVLPDRISKEPIAAVVRFGDDQWLEIVNWVFRAPVAAEELGIDTKNIATFTQTTDPSIRRFLGFEPGISDGFGLDARWPFNVVSTIGNYGEIFERNLGPNTPLAMDRGMNRLWTNGGLMYSPPFR